MCAERNFLSTPDGNISYLRDGNGTPFIMVHGLMSNALDYHFQFEKFRDRYTCIAPDLKGAGKSSTENPKEVSISSAVDNLIDLATELVPVDQKFILMGHSFGGLVSLETFTRIPERVKAFIIIASPAAISHNNTTRTSIATLNALLPVLKPVMTNSRIINFYSRYLNMNPAHLTPDLKRVLKKRNVLINESDLYAMAGYLNSIRGWEFSIPSSCKNIPCAVIYGNRDPLFNRGDLKKIKSLLPQAQSFLINGTGHSCMQEKPEEFNAVLHEFLSGVI